MFLSVSRIQNLSQIQQNISFNAKGTKFAEKLSESSKNINEKIGLAGWFITIALLVTGWISGCNDIMQRKEVKQAVEEVPEVMPSAPADTLDYTI